MHKGPSIPMGQWWKTVWNRMFDLTFSYCHIIGGVSDYFPKKKGSQLNLSYPGEVQHITTFKLKRKITRIETSSWRGMVNSSGTCWNSTCKSISEPIKLCSLTFHVAGLHLLCLKVLTDSYHLKESASFLHSLKCTLVKKNFLNADKWAQSCFDTTQRLLQM